MLPPLTPINDRDLELLDASRIERFRSRFGQILTRANLYISGLDRALIISGGHETGALRYRTGDLKEQSWQVCGCTWVKVYANNELILNSESSYNKLSEESRGGSMATAIQEEVMLAAEDNGVTTTDMAPPSPNRSAKIIRSMALEDIAADLESSVDSLQAFLESQSAMLIDFGGTILVPENMVIIAYEQYSLIRARQKMEERFLSLNSKVEDSIPQEKIKNNVEKPKKNYLTWKSSFKVNKSSYKKTLQNALNALFPDAPDDQDLALSDIISQSDMGKAYLDKILRDPAYTDKTRAREQLLKAAGELASDNNQSSGEQQEEEAVA